jgi:hypothetical protein
LANCYNCRVGNRPALLTNVEDVAGSEGEYACSVNGLKMESHAK